MVNYGQLWTLFWNAHDTFPKIDSIGNQLSLNAFQMIELI